MTLPFDVTKPEIRDRRVIFYTDDATADWIEEQAESTALGISLLCHRMAKAARATALGEGTLKRRASDAA